ncbi:3'-5' exonuclease [Halorubrum ezzemoulense]|uniref:3'-5' exonuclease n=1 Tax=Halorubrum ezzemoulense TaxID=337243 RepID=UPI00233058DC|nr:3'-5' exonuclease [Halorubrum ezzemoulense]MDB9235818.1 3'-5' exonuclease [Halorubrum ezzemoulense]
MSAYVEQIDGAPGAGKTYQLRRRLEREAADDLTLADFYWLNFTNSGREDVEPEIRETFTGADATGETDPTDRAKTFHGLALSLVIREGAVDPDAFDEQIIQQNGDNGTVDPFADFCRRQGLEYDPNESDPKKLLSGVDQTKHTGNTLFAINDYLTATYKPPEKWRHAGLSTRIPNSRVPDLLEAWDEYKRNPPEHDFRLFEHGDYIEYAADRALTPPVDVLFIDEFQDLAPAEYRLFKLWRDHGPVDRMYIAGDPNQAIYSFRGGSPYYFENTDVDDVADLTASRRCPEHIAAAAGAVLEAHADTDPRGFAGFDAGGVVRWPTFTDKTALRDVAIEATDRYQSAPSVLFLTRTNRQLYQLRRDLQDVGIPFEVLGRKRGVWADDDLADMLEVLNGLTAGADSFDADAVRTLRDALTDRLDYAKTFGEVALGEDVRELFDRYQSADAIASRVDVRDYKREALRNAVRATAAIAPGEVQVGTIHTAKGLEAPTVYLFTASTDRIVSTYERQPEKAAEEHRVYYVGATRASEELHLVDDYFSGPLAPPLKQARHRLEVVA